MSTFMPTITAPRLAVVPIGMHRVTVDEYERMIASGSLDEPERVELINGYTVDKMGKSAEHGFSTKRVIKSLDGRLPGGWTWRSEQPIRIPAYDEPEPDVSVVRGRDEDYEHRLPAPGDVGLAVEISLTTLDRDRDETGPAHARGGIPIYWIVNLLDRRIEVYTDPGPDGYRSGTDYGEGQAVPVVIGGQRVGEMDVRSVLPSQPMEPGIGGNGA